MITEIIARIKATVPAIKLVGEAADFQTAAEKNPNVTPACFVIALEESPAPNAYGNLMQQQVRAAVGIVIVVRNVGDISGGAARLTMESLRKQLKDQLFGWTPAAGLDPLERGNSNLLAFRDGHMWWQDVYLTEYYDRSVL